MTKQTDITKCRIEFLKRFDDYVINVIGDDDITDLWLTKMPDGWWAEDDLEEIALDDSMWLDIVECFAKCCKFAGII